MNKYIKTIERMCRESLVFFIATFLICTVLTILLFVSFVLTNGLTLLAALLLWAYIIYKETKKNG